MTTALRRLHQRRLEKLRSRRLEDSGYGPTPVEAGREEALAVTLTPATPGLGLSVSFGNRQGSTVKRVTHE